MSSSPPFQVAIVGGGLCGLALAIALNKRNIPFTIYESRPSFTEIGAGINLAPNGMRALCLIDASLGEKVRALGTRNPPPYEDTWMWFRYGAASGDHEDGEIIAELLAPGTGSSSLHRQELLKLLATEMGHEHARFNKKLVAYSQNEDAVTMKFADGTEEQASMLVGCDGIHSKVRMAKLGTDNPASKPHFNHDGAYRAVIPMEKALEAIGETARHSQALFGPDGYFISYPISGGTAVNCGVWMHKPEEWTREGWVLHDQKEAFEKDLRNWGPRVHRLVEHFDPSPAFWSAHQHTKQPSSFTDGRVILVGDGAHSMPPHQGNGASQAVEDAYVLAEVLAQLNQEPSNAEVHAALRAAMDIRQPRFSLVQKFSTISGPLWYSFYEQHLECDQRDQWVEGLQSRFEQIWGVDIAGEAEKAKARMKELIS